MVTVMERHLLDKKDEAFYRRREFMTMICHPTNIEPVEDMDNDQEEVIYDRIWVPFYTVSIIATWSATALKIIEVEAQFYMLVFSYVFFLGVGSTFGGQTFGRDIYGGIVLLTEQPFEVGDIISVEASGGAGGCMDTLVTGFVERISVRRTIIRRFDMRACHVPNGIMAANLISNWQRPRKLIFLEFAVSQRSPLKDVKRFGQEALNIVKNHPDVDQKLYTKAVFRKLQTGINYRIVCYNQHGTKKQFVQQDLVFRLSELARKFGLMITFNEATRSIIHEDFKEHYIRDTGCGEDVVLAEVVPPKKDKTPKPKCAPEGFIIVRLERATRVGDLVPQTTSADRVFFTDIQYGDNEPRERKARLMRQHLKGSSSDVDFQDTFEFNLDEVTSVRRHARLQVYVEVSKQKTMIAEAELDLPTLALTNFETSVVKLTPQHPTSVEAAIGVRVFVGTDLVFIKPSDELQDGSDDDVVGSIDGEHEEMLSSFVHYKQRMTVTAAPAGAAKATLEKGGKDTA
eukprot:TRINITY_DN25797_c0_g1_i2.p1 TRINITY_DN25797_c0_g1~~TRINITY_DN25797_c0_g1_i2.p1  ORF type:complete len:514 (+),score=104.28 TRINITY_DN25797_c0_g1_i2:221-1762(+)